MELHAKFIGLESEFRVYSKDRFDWGNAIDLKEIKKNGFQHILFNDHDGLTIDKSVKFINCQFNSLVTFSGVTGDVEIELIDCVFMEGFQFLNLLDPNVTLLNCVICKGTDLLPNPIPEIAPSIELIQCEFESFDSLIFNGFNRVFIENCELEEVKLESTVNQLVVRGEHTRITTLSARGANIERIQLSNSCIVDKVYLFHTGETDIHLNESEHEIVKIHRPHGSITVVNCNSTLMSIILSSSKDFEVPILISNECKIGSLEIDGTHNSANIDLLDCDINRIKLENFLTGKILLSKLKRAIIFIASYVEAEICFNAVSIKKMSLSNSEFENWKFQMVDWDRKFQLFEIGEYNATENERLEKHLLLLDTSRKLKSYFLNEGNNFYAEIFKTSELRSYYHILKLKVFRGKSSFSQKIDFIIIGTNKWFSGFGTNPLRSLVGLFIFHTLFFLILVKNPQVAQEFCFEWSADCGFGYFLSLINPVHKLTGSNGTPVYLTVDFLMRISSGYFIYYFLKSSRKFSRI